MRKHMIMKAAAITTAVCALLALNTSCTSDPEGIYGSYPYIEINSGYTDLTFTSSSSFLDIPIRTNRDILINDNCNWLDATYYKKTSTLRIDVKQNTGLKRSTTLTIHDRNNSIKRNISITQLSQSNTQN